MHQARFPERTVLRWMIDGVPVEMPAWHDAGGNLWALPPIGVQVKLPAGTFRVDNVVWEYTDIRQLPARITIQLRSS